MKKIFLSLSIILLSAMALTAQGNALPPIYESADQLVERYELNDEQIQELDVILTTRSSNLAAIESLRETDEVLFWKKRRAVFVGQQASIERILVTKEQLTSLAELRIEHRRAESDMIKELLAAGHSREEARLLLLRQRY